MKPSLHFRAASPLPSVISPGLRPFGAEHLSAIGDANLPSVTARITERLIARIRVAPNELEAFRLIDRLATLQSTRFDGQLVTSSSGQSWV
jgi:hypothetical protein